MKKLIDRIRGLGIEHLWILAVLVGVFSFANTQPIRQNDFWFHLATGREIVLTGQIPQEDTFSFTQLGSPYPSNNIYWLMQIASYLVYDAGGAAWTILFTSLTLTLAYSLIAWVGWKFTGNWRAAAASVFFAALLGIDNWNVRPQIAAYLFAAGCLTAILMYRLEGNRTWLFIYPLILIGWVNSHGSFFIGLVLVFFWGCEEAWGVFQGWRRTKQLDWQNLKAPFWVGIASGAACLINPQGIGIVHYLTGMSISPVIQELILEWQPPDFTQWLGIAYVLMLILTGVFLAMRKRRVELFYWLCYFFFGILGLRYVRAIVWFGIFLSPMVAVAIDQFMQRITSQAGNKPPERSAPILNWSLVAVIGLLAVLSLPWFKSLWPVRPEKKGLLAYDTPIQAAQFLVENKLPEPIFHDLAFGSYFDWAIVPPYHVFVDSRIELYPLEIWDDYLKLGAAVEGWQERLDHYGFKTLVLHPKYQTRLIDAVGKSDQWEKVYEDGAALIFIRR